MGRALRSWRVSDYGRTDSSVSRRRPGWRIRGLRDTMEISSRWSVGFAAALILAHSAVASAQSWKLVEAAGRSSIVTVKPAAIVIESSAGRLEIPLAQVVEVGYSRRLLRPDEVIEQWASQGARRSERPRGRRRRQRGRRAPRGSGYWPLPPSKRWQCPSIASTLPGSTRTAPAFRPPCWRERQRLAHSSIGCGRRLRSRPSSGLPTDKDAALYSAHRAATSSSASETSVTRSWLAPGTAFSVHR